MVGTTIALILITAEAETAGITYTKNICCKLHISWATYRNETHRTRRQTFLYKILSSKGKLLALLWHAVLRSMLENYDESSTDIVYIEKQILTTIYFLNENYANNISESLETNKVMIKKYYKERNYYLD